MEEIKKCMRQVKTIIPSGCGVMDTTGKILAATDEANEDQTDPSFRAVMSSDNLFASTADRTYLKVFIGEQLKYIIYIENTDQDAKISLQLIAEWLKTLVKEKGTTLVVVSHDLALVQSLGFRQAPVEIMHDERGELWSVLGGRK